MPGVKRRAPVDLPALAEQLVAEPRAKANNLPVLLAALTPGCSEVRDVTAARLHARARTPARLPPLPPAAARRRLPLPSSASLHPLPPCCLQATPVLHSLRIFFIDAFDRGDLSVKPPSVKPPSQEAEQSAEAVFSAWLHRQYCTYQAALLRLLGHPEADARTQVGAGHTSCCIHAALVAPAPHSLPGLAPTTTSKPLPSPASCLPTPTCPLTAGVCMALMECVHEQLDRPPPTPSQPTHFPTCLPACLQVSAFMALMECVRGEQPGVFNNRLFSRVLGVLLGSEGTAPEVLGLLIGRFLGGWVTGWVDGVLGCWGCCWAAKTRRLRCSASSLAAS